MTNIFSNKGKSTRMEFWTTCIICIVIICIVGPMIDNISNPMYHDLSIFGLIFISCWIFSSVTRKRCHDLGISSWKQFNPRYCLDIPFKKGSTE